MFTLALVALAVLAAPASAALATVYEGCTMANAVALTFDDGPYNFESQLVSTLNDADVKGTFFVNGNNWRCIYDQEMVDSMRAAFDQGHEFLSHTWRHSNLSELSRDAIGDQMSRTELALQRILGVSPAIMRPPYGEYNNLVRQVAALRNQSLVMWDFDSGDSTGSTPAQSIQAYKDLADRQPDNILTLNHEVYKPTVEQVIPKAITALKDKGYTFVTVSECLGIPAYQWRAEQQTRTADWNCDV